MEQRTAEHNSSADFHAVCFRLLATPRQKKALTKLTLIKICEQ